MVRRALNVLSPIAALAVVWASLNTFGFTNGEAALPDPLLAPPVTMATQDLLPELTSVSQILASASTVTLGESVPASVKDVLVASGALLLVPRQTGRGVGL